jgi:thiosulfate/3-mercaptopyruvate sulfurtransferase
MAVGRLHWRRSETGKKQVPRLLGALTVLIVTAVGMDGVAYDLGLIDANALSTQKNRWVILDARPQSAWRVAHLPHALSFSWEDYTRTDAQKIPYRIWPPSELAAALGAMGIDERTPVVVYGDADTSWGGEGWVCWALIWLGHQGPIRLLDGGVGGWQRAGLAMNGADGDQRHPRTTYHVQLRAEVSITAKEVATLNDNQVLVDTRSNWEWFTGHLPAAVHLPWESLFHGKDRRPIGALAYRSELQECGIKETDTLVFYCTGGIRSAYAWVIHRLYETSAAKNFEGGTEAWEQIPSR